MQKSIKTTVLGSALGCIAFFTVPATAQELSLSGNAGILSDYIFRGILQSSGVGNGGLDAELGLGPGAIYAGVWAADVDPGIEYDLYGGYSLAIADFNLGAGVTLYRYSDDFDDDYDEVNLHAGYGPLALDYAIGTYAGDFNGDGDDDDDYDFLAATLEYAGLYATYGTFGLIEDKEFDGDFVEVGYTTEVNDFELTGALVNSGDKLDDETHLYVGVSYAFDIL